MRRKKTKSNRGRRPSKIISRHKDTMTCREVAYESGLGLETIYDAVRRGELPYRKIGRRQIISRTAYQNWLAAFGRSAA